MRPSIEAIPQDLFEKLDEIYKEKLDQGLEVCLPVPTDSMFPVIKPGETIRVKRMSQYEKGDVVLFCEKNFYIVHRLIKIGKDSAVTKGDNNPYNDKEIDIDRLRGKVVGITDESTNFDQEYGNYIAKISFLKRRLFIKFKNFCFKNYENTFIKLFLTTVYKLNILLVKLVFINSKETVFIRGSYIQGTLIPGLSDLDYIIISNGRINYKKLMWKIKKLESLSPILSFNSILDVELYELFHKYGLIDSINDKQKYQREIGPEVYCCDTNEYVKSDLQNQNEFLYYVSSLLVKFSQLRSHHPHYIYHNIKKIYLRLYNYVDLKEEKKNLIDYFTIDRSKTIRKDSSLYAKHLFKILKKFDEKLDPKYSFNLEKYSLMESIKGKDYYVFDRLERLEAFVLNEDYDESDIEEFIKYFSDEHVQIFSTGVISQKMVNCLSILNIESLLTLEEEIIEEDLKYSMLRNGFLFNKYFSLKTESIEYFKYLHEANLRLYVLLKYGEKAVNTSSAIKALQKYDTLLAKEVILSLKNTDDLRLYDYFHAVRPLFNKLIKKV